MRATQWMVFLAAFMCFSFASATFWPRGGYRAGGEVSAGFDYSNWNTCGSSLRGWLGIRLGEIRPNFDDRCRLRNREIEGYELRNSYVTGVSAFELGNECYYTGYGNSIRLRMSLNFGEFRTSCGLYALESSGSFFGDFARIVSGVIRNLSHLVFEFFFGASVNLVYVDLNVQFDGGVSVIGCSFNEGGLNEGRILSGSIRRHRSLVPYFRNAIGGSLKFYFETDFKTRMEQQIRSWRCRREHFPILSGKGNSSNRRRQNSGSRRSEDEDDESSAEYSRRQRSGSRGSGGGENQSGGEYSRREKSKSKESGSEGDQSGGEYRRRQKSKSKESGSEGDQSGGEYRRRQKSKSKESGSEDDQSGGESRTRQKSGSGGSGGEDENEEGYNWSEESESRSYNSCNRCRNGNDEEREETVTVEE